MTEEQLWALSPIVVVPRKEGKKLLEVLEVSQASGLSDTSALKLQAILSGEDHEWRIYAKKAVGAGKVHLDLIRKVDTPKTIKHGGVVVTTDYSRAEMDVIAAANDVIWKTIISELGTGKDQGVWRSMMVPRAAARAAV